MNVGDKKQDQMGSEAAQHFTISGVALCACVCGVCGVCVHPFLFEYAKPLPNASCLITLRAAGPRAFDTIHYTVLKGGIIPS